jgi:hypothetical protein
MSVLPLRFVNGELKMNATLRIDMPALAVAPEPVVVVAEVPTVAPEPEPVVVVEVPTVAASEVEAPLEVPQTSPESALAPENPPTE